MRRDKQAHFGENPREFGLRWGKRRCQRSLLERKDGLLVEVQANPQDEPKQIVAGAADRVEGAMDMARELLLKAVEPVASVRGELNRDLTIEQVEIGLGLGFEATGKLFIAQGTGTANVNFKLTVRPKQQG